MNSPGIVAHSTIPEQAELSGLDIDTRSDIYSLGSQWQALYNLKDQGGFVRSQAFSPESRVALL